MSGLTKRETYLVVFGVLTIFYASLLGAIFSDFGKIKFENANLAEILLSIGYFPIISVLPLVMLQSGYAVLDLNFRKLWLYNVVYAVINGISCLAAEVLWNANFLALGIISTGFQLTVQSAAVIIWMKYLGHKND